MQFKTLLTAGSTLVTALAAAVVATVLCALAIDGAPEYLDASTREAVSARNLAGQRALEAYFAELGAQLQTLAGDAAIDTTLRIDDEPETPTGGRVDADTFAVEADAGAKLQTRLADVRGRFGLSRLLLVEATQDRVVAIAGDGEGKPASALAAVAASPSARPLLVDGGDAGPAAASVAFAIDDGARRLGTLVAEVPGSRLAALADGVVLAGDGVARTTAAAKPVTDTARRVRLATPLDEVVDERGDTWLAAQAPLALDGLDWRLVSLHDMRDLRALHHRLTRELPMFALLLVLGLIGAGTTVGWLAARLLIRPLEATCREAGAIAAAVRAGHGDLTSRLAVQRGDAFAEVARTINELLDATRTHLAEMTATLEGLRAAAAAVETHTQKLALGTTAQMGEATEVATAMNEMAASIDEVARSAVMAAERTRTADVSAHEGTRVVAASKRIFEQLAADFDHTVATVERLEAASEEIGGMLGVIQSIAEQTNLLALNAAIEAARAGEQGRGFAVVADEVRTLAGRTQQSTLQIESIIEQLQEQARAASAMVRDGQQVLGEGIDQAHAAGNALDSIAASLGTLDGMNAHVATAAEEQSAVCNEVNANVHRIMHAAERLHEVVQTSAAASAELRAAAGRVRVVAGKVAV
ncbi:MAG: methyl-accepting chemotaxis protein [Gammaproteobacteria bacterium]